MNRSHVCARAGLLCRSLRRTVSRDATKIRKSSSASRSSFDTCFSTARWISIASSSQNAVSSHSSMTVPSFEMKSASDLGRQTAGNSRPRSFQHAATGGARSDLPLSSADVGRDRQRRSRIPSSALAVDMAAYRLFSTANAAPDWPEINRRSQKERESCDSGWGRQSQQLRPIHDSRFAIS